LTQVSQHVAEFPEQQFEELQALHEAEVDRLTAALVHRAK
jgi:hypothetical protein